MSGMTRWHTLGGTVAVVGCLLALYLLRPGTGELPPSGLRAQELATSLNSILDRPRSPVPGVAVLPLAAHGDDPDLLAAVSAFCDLLVRRLQRIEGLRTTSCASTQASHRLELPVTSLTSLLQVDHVVSGEIHATDGLLQVTLRFSSLEPERERWQLQQSATLAELDALAERTGGRIASTLDLGQSDSPAAAIDPDAYALYLRARQLMRVHQLDPLTRAEALLIEALAIEPAFAEARISFLLNRTHVLSAHAMAGTREPEELLQEQQRLLGELREVALDILATQPDAPIALSVLLNDAFQGRRSAEALDHAERLLGLGARDPEILRAIARLFQATGYLQRARETALSAASIDPLTSMSHYTLAMISRMQGQTARALQEATLARELGLDVARVVFAFDAMTRGAWEDAERELSAALAAAGQPTDFVAPFIAGLADEAQRDAAVLMLESQDPGRQFYMLNYMFYYATLGDLVRTRRAAELNGSLTPGVWMLEFWHPELHSFRSEPAFIEVMDGLGVVSAWERHGPPDDCQRHGASWRCR